jgi:hypothetical protein
MSGADDAKLNTPDTVSVHAHPTLDRPRHKPRGLINSHAFKRLLPAARPAPVDGMAVAEVEYDLGGESG